MPTFDATRARCRVFTFKDGALAAIAHDLEIDVTRFSIALDDAGSIDARFDAASLRVLHAVANGRPTAALGEGDKRKIERTIVDEVLDARRHPEIRLVAPAPRPSGDGHALDGELTLCGRTRRLAISTRADGDAQIAVVTLHQPDFGITPYRAMLGALRLRPEVRVEVRLPDVNASAR